MFIVVVIFIVLMIIICSSASSYGTKHSQCWNEVFEITHMTRTRSPYWEHLDMSLRNDKRAFTKSVSEEIFARYREGDKIMVRIVKRPGGQPEYYIVGPVK